MEHSTRPGTIATSTAPAQAVTAPLVIITALFFMWGLLTSLNDVLIPHLKEVYTLSYSQVMLVQSCFFGAYLFASLPAGFADSIGVQHSFLVPALCYAFVLFYGIRFARLYQPNT